jgi:transcriptional regulator with XRE-family HTH domain
MSTGTRIRRAREQKGYSQRDMADRLSMSQNNYHKIENDRVKVKADDLLKIAQILDTSVNDLLPDKQVVYNIKPHSNYDQSINGLIIQRDILDKEQKLYEQLLQNKDELLAAQAKLLAQYEAEIGNLKKQLAGL